MSYSVTTILVPSDARAYVYDNYWRRAACVRSGEPFDYGGVSFVGEWDVYVYKHVDRDVASDMKYQLDRIGSGMRSAFGFLDDQGIGYHSMRTEWIDAEDFGSLPTQHGATIKKEGA